MKSVATINFCLVKIQNENNRFCYNRKSCSCYHIGLQSFKSSSLSSTQTVVKLGLCISAGRQQQTGQLLWNVQGPAPVLSRCLQENEPNTHVFDGGGGGGGAHTNMGMGCELQTDVPCQCFEPHVINWSAAPFNIQPPTRNVLLYHVIITWLY